MTALGFLDTLGNHIFFLRDVLKNAWAKKFERREFLIQLAQVSWRSLPTTLTAGLFTGAIMAIQFHLQLRDFGAQTTLGGLATSGTLREVGPILIAFMLAGKVGAFTSAELGTMKVTDQVEAIRCLGVDPLSFLVVPRFFAVILSSILLLVFGLVISVTGGLLAAWIAVGLDPSQYLLMIPLYTSGQAVLLAVIKAVIFGALMGHICCANGFWTTGGTQGVGRAVRTTAVQSMVAIVLADFVISWIFAGVTQ
jgi:phospholipid/cholesterol/gamma-HCH transport system permease protein